jgi:co-chaperonin GroES (HSP10)
MFSNKEKEIIEYKPLNDRILSLRTEWEHKTAGGILYLTHQRKKPLDGKVIAHAPKCIMTKVFFATEAVKENDRFCQQDVQA